MSEYIAKASIEPRDYRVVFLIQKPGNPCACYRISGLFLCEFAVFFHTVDFTEIPV